MAYVTMNELNNFDIWDESWDENQEESTNQDYVDLITKTNEYGEMYINMY